MSFYAHSEHAANQDTIREFVGRGVGTELFGSIRSTCTLSVRVVVVLDLTHHYVAFGMLGHQIYFLSGLVVRFLFLFSKELSFNLTE